MKYFGFALADSMFASDCTISRQVLVGVLKDAVDGLEAVHAFLDGDVKFCLNPSHQATIDAAVSRFGLRLEIPDRPPSVTLYAGDSILVMGVRGLPRLTDRHEYTAEEIASASFAFTLYTVGESVDAAYRRGLGDGWREAEAEYLR
jgi:hypothetical protein